MYRRPNDTAARTFPTRSRAALAALACALLLGLPSCSGLGGGFGGGLAGLFAPGDVSQVADRAAGHSGTGGPGDILEATGRLVTAIDRTETRPAGR